MKAYRWMLHVIRARTVPAEGPPEALRTGPLAWAAHGILILVLGSVGVGAAAASAYGGAGHASAHNPAGNIRRTANAYPMSSSQIIDMPWMY